ncbi:MAG: hypothetical protein P4L99_11725 [Chthoniobacter sp.]|nr:hypothetical protein [Chthoniobacter sp.]
MKKLSLCLLAVIAITGCDKKEEDTDAEPASGAPSVAKAPPATPKPGDWMWKGDGKATPNGSYSNPLSGPTKGRGTPDKYGNPLSTSNNLLDQKKK